MRKREKKKITDSEKSKSIVGVILFMTWRDEFIATGYEERKPGTDSLVVLLSYCLLPLFFYFLTEGEHI